MGVTKRGGKICAEGSFRQSARDMLCFGIHIMPFDTALLPIVRSLLRVGLPFVIPYICSYMLVSMGSSAAASSGLSCDDTRL